MAQSDSEYVKNEIKNTIDKIKKLEAEDEALVKANGIRKQRIEKSVVQRQKIPK